MKKLSTHKGITLVALIITIIVLLILAVVAIRAVQGDGIIEYAKNAKTDYQAAQANEDAILAGYLTTLEQELGTGAGQTEGWTQNGTVVTNAKTGQTLNVGDYVNYVARVDGYSDTNGWRILGVENGKVLIISSDNVGTVELNGMDGYNNYETKLASVYSNFGNGDYAAGVRSVKVEDIDRVTGYSVETTTDGNTIGAGTIYEYGNPVTYTVGNDGKIAYTDGGDFSGTTSYSVFIHPDGRVLMSDDTWNSASTEEKAGYTRVDSITVTNDMYFYDPATLGYPTDLDNFKTVGYAADNEAYKMLFGTSYTTTEITNPTGYTGEMPYWLASPCAGAFDDCAYFGLRYVGGGLVCGNYLWFSSGSPYGEALGVRAVVSLEPNVTLTSAGSNSWTLS